MLVVNGVGRGDVCDVGGGGYYKLAKGEGGGGECKQAEEKQ